MPTTVYLRKHSQVQFEASDFSEPQFLLHVGGLRATSLYAELRARGEDCLGAFVAVFGEHVGGQPNDLVVAAEHYERTSNYALAFEDAVERIGIDALRHEWDQRAAELSVVARDHAAFLRSHSTALENKVDGAYSGIGNTFERVLAERTREAAKRIQKERFESAQMHSPDAASFTSRT
ncbi:hypothetical protein B0G80_0245 [Paraburkholderia sp. BL6669N2]|uniref:hypothetical protein n=1 Tax=Paraburkholderia sp. BL6669N2 TaxID=1938807 RepID=UPI000E36BEBD|nr:hypothetical protein [Paraburkholderia sp. BL6669N2]REG57621.1 hypothetical protein B0G80_0245 [Paraburkholderia sp. BL6669N2]